MEEVFINIKLIIGNRESGTGSLFLIGVNLWDISKLLIGSGNQEPGTNSLFLIWVYITNVSKVHIGNKEPVLGSF